MNGLKRLSIKERQLLILSLSRGALDFQPLGYGFHQKRFISSSNKQKSATHYYDILGITRQATAQQIKSAYYKLSKEYHPDVNKKPGANRMFHEISEAYEILGKESSRSEYDNRHRTATHPNWDGKSSPFGQRQGFKAKQTYPGTGRSPIYNFDEHYRRHYEELRTRKQSEKQRMYEAYAKHSGVNTGPKERYSGVGSKNEHIDSSSIGVLVIIAMITAFLFRKF